MGRPGRFRSASAFKGFTGLALRASETGQSDRLGQPMSKAGPCLLREQLVRSAETARQVDPQLAEAYFRQMTERGAAHTKALCVVAARLAERAWAVLARGEPYVVRDVDGTAVTPAEARAIVAERYAVPAEVRARRRAKKVGKAPQQVLEARGKPDARGVGRRGDLPRRSSSALPGSPVKRLAEVPA